MGLLDSIKDFFTGKREEPEGATPEADSPGILQEILDAAVTEDGDLRETVTGAMTGFEKLMAKIPGYKGYKDKELRREADKLLRDQLAKQLGDQHKRLTGQQVQLVSAAQIEYVDDVERAVMKLQLLIDRVKTASYGYAGLFDAVKVKEAQLDALYEFDSQMLDYADDVAAGVDEVSSAISVKEGIAQAIASLTATLDEANQTFGHREEAILQAADL